MTLPTDAETLLRMWSGFHSTSAIFLIAWAANFGVVIQHRDLGVGLLLQQVLRVDPGLALVVGLPAHGPWEVLGVIPLGGAGGDEQLRHLLGVHVFVDRRIRRRPQRIENEQHLIALDQLARLLDRLRRTVAVIIADEIDLAAIDAA